jgi:hypothetical protein
VAASVALNLLCSRVLRPTASSVCLPAVGVMGPILNLAQGRRPGVSASREASWSKLLHGEPQ